METVMKADIFFFVTTITVIVFLVLGSIACLYLIGILRNVKRATDLLGKKLEETSEHLEEIREKVVHSALFNFIFKKK